jgi:hypothetical protein
MYKSGSFLKTIEIKKRKLKSKLINTTINFGTETPVLFFF